MIVVCCHWASTFVRLTIVEMVVDPETIVKTVHDPGTIVKTIVIVRPGMTA